MLPHERDPENHIIVVKIDHIKIRGELAFPDGEVQLGTEVDLRATAYTSKMKPYGLLEGVGSDARYAPKCRADSVHG